MTEGEDTEQRFPLPPPPSGKSQPPPPGGGGSSPATQTLPPSLKGRGRTLSPSLKGRGRGWVGQLEPVGSTTRKPTHPQPLPSREGRDAKPWHAAGNLPAQRHPRSNAHQGGGGTEGDGGGGYGTEVSLTSPLRLASASHLPLAGEDQARPHKLFPLPEREGPGVGRPAPARRFDHAEPDPPPTPPFQGGARRRGLARSGQSPALPHSRSNAHQSSPARGGGGTEGDGSGKTRNAGRPSSAPPLAKTARNAAPLDPPEIISHHPR